MESPPCDSLPRCQTAPPASRCCRPDCRLLWGEERVWSASVWTDFGSKASSSSWPAAGRDGSLSFSLTDHAPTSDHRRGRATQKEPMMPHYRRHFHCLTRLGEHPGTPRPAPFCTSSCWLWRGSTSFRYLWFPLTFEYEIFYGAIHQNYHNSFHLLTDTHFALYVYLLKEQCVKNDQNLLNSKLTSTEGLGLGLCKHANQLAPAVLTRKALCSTKGDRLMATAQLLNSSLSFLHVIQSRHKHNKTRQNSLVVSFHNRLRFGRNKSSHPRGRGENIPTQHAVCTYLECQLSLAALPLNSCQ